MIGLIAWGGYTLFIIVVLYNIYNSLIIDISTGKGYIESGIIEQDSLYKDMVSALDTKAELDNKIITINGINYIQRGDFWFRQFKLNKTIILELCIGLDQPESQAKGKAELYIQSMVIDENGLNIKYNLELNNRYQIIKNNLEHKYADADINRLNYEKYCAVHRIKWENNNV